MGWTELIPKNLDDMYCILHAVSDTQMYVFRGHASQEWKTLLSSIQRILGSRYSAAERVMLEADGIRAFRRHARSFLPSPELYYFDRILDGLTLMQHYGGPTRLLDWTLSPWVAAYFAGGEPTSDPGAIWAFNSAQLLKNHSDSANVPAERRKNKFKLFERLTGAVSVDEWAEAALGRSNHINIFRYQYANPQMSAQQSLFTISGTLEETHEITLARALPDKRDTLRIIVPQQLKKELRQRLFRMNVNALSLFPTMDGVGRHISEALQSDCPLGDLSLLYTLRSRAKA